MGNFRGPGVQLLWMVDPYHFTGLIFADMHAHAYYVLYVYIQAYFMGLIFAVRRLFMNNSIIGPLENFPLYSTLLG